MIENSSERDVILVTGGAGFIGSHFVERLVSAGYTVVNLDLLTYAGNKANLAALAGNPRHIFVHGDIGDRTLVRKLLTEHKPRTVFNMAAESHVDRSIDAAEPFIKANVTGVYRLLDECLTYWKNLDTPRRARFRYVQMSTDEVYGSISEGAFTEDSNYAPNSPYAASKAAGDHFVRAYCVTHDLPTAIVHASNCYGPRQYPEKLIPHMVISALAGKPLPVYGDGSNVRDWLFVGDLVAGLQSVVEKAEAGGCYNFAGCDEWRNIDTVKALCLHLDRLAPAQKSHANAVTYVTDRPGHDLRYAMSIDHVQRRFGWEPKTRFGDGLSQTVAWYLDNRQWWADVLARGYEAVRIGQGKS